MKRSLFCVLALATICMLGACGEKNRISFGIELAVYERHLEFVFKIRDRPQTLDDCVGFPESYVFGKQTVEAFGFNIRNVRDRSLYHIQSFLRRKGRILSRTTWWEPAVLRGTVNLSSRETFFVRAGDLVGRLSVFLFVLLFAAALIRRK